MNKRHPVVMTMLAAAILGGCSGHRSTEAIRESGEFRFRQGDYLAAAEEYQEVVARYPGDWDAQYKLGVSMLELGQVQEARRALEIAHTRRPHDVAVCDALSEAMYRQGDETQLFAFLRNQAETTQSVHAWLQLARYSLELDDPDSAQVAVETAIQLDAGQTIDPYLTAADLAQRLGDLDETVRRLRQAYGIDPHNTSVSNRLRTLGEVPGPTIALPPGR